MCQAWNLTGERGGDNWNQSTYNAIKTGKREMIWSIFLLMVAFFRNNVQTDQMLKYIEELEEKMQHVLNFERLHRE